MAMAYGLTFDDPSWVPFAVTQMTLDVLKAEVDEAVDEIEKAADRALRRIGSNAQSVSSQVQIMAEAQTAAFEGFRKAALAREHEATARYQKVLAELSAGQVGKLVEKSANGIVQDVVQKLTGDDGQFMRGVARHTVALEQTQQRFVASMEVAVARVDGAAKNAAVSIRRPVRHVVMLSMATVVLYAVATFGFAAFWSAYRSPVELQPPETCSTAHYTVRPSAD